MKVTDLSLNKHIYGIIWFAPKLVNSLFINNLIHGCFSVKYTENGNFLGGNVF